MLASDIVSRAGRILSDQTNVRWSESELLNYVTDGQFQVVLQRPDAYSINESMPCVDGSKQAIPAGGIRFLRCTRNMGSDGATPGKAIRPAYSREALDAELPDWHYANSTAGTPAEHYVFDDVDPKHFYLYPAPYDVATTPLQVEVIYSKAPSAVTAVGDTLDLDDQYLNPVLDWVLYRAFSKDADYAGNRQRAAQYLQAFGMELGVQMEIGFLMSGPDGRDAAQTVGRG